MKRKFIEIERRLKREQLTIEALTDGSIVLKQTHKGLVLSGGGAKGITYAGMIQAMEEQEFLAQLSHISGASAGAMTASLLAIGMPAADITSLVKNINMAEILQIHYRQGHIRSTGKGFQALFDLIYLYQLDGYMANIAEPEGEENKAHFKQLLKKVKSYKSLLERLEIKIENINDIIALTKHKKFSALAKALLNLEASQSSPDNIRVTFSDLQKLKGLLPPEKNHLIKDLSIVVTNQTKSELEVYNVSQSPEATISEKVQQSGAHPFIFQPSFNQKGEFIADGGILDNMPIQPLLDLGLDREQILCVKALPNSQYHARKTSALKALPDSLSLFSRALDKTLSPVFGGKVIKNRLKVKNREKIFYHLNNMLFLNSGAITTTSISSPDALKNEVIRDAYQTTQKLLAMYQDKTFDNALLAFLYIGQEQLESILMQIKDSSQLKSAGYAQKVFSLQRIMAEDLQQKSTQYIEEHLLEIEEILSTAELQLSEKQQQQALSLCLKQVDYMTDGKLGLYLNKKITEATEPPKKSWFTVLLELLYQPIQWLFGLSSPKTQQQPLSSHFIAFKDCLFNSPQPALLLESEQLETNSPELPLTTL